MKITVNPERREWNKLTQRYEAGDQDIAASVEQIVCQVRDQGDEAIIKLSASIDGVKLSRIEVPSDIVASAADKIRPELRKAIDTAAGNIRKFHTAQLCKGIDMETLPGVRCLQRNVPVNRVGLYVPGGSAPLFSTVLMLAIPAKVAGCSEIILCTPPSGDDDVSQEILYAASVCGVDRVFLVGGAQAIAAMAFGTQSIPLVDKIFGPGNRYVTKAKQYVSMSQTAIDMPAGPSEVMVMADSSARPEFVAADMLSQAEHGGDSQAIALVDSRSLAEQVFIQIKEQLQLLPRAAVTRHALKNSHIIVMDDKSDMLDFANEYAAEHLIISMENPWDVVDKITSAGSIFIGNYSPESAGDYASGTNHTLPTSGWARAYSGVNTDSFMKKITIQEISETGLSALGNTIVTMAEAEGLQAHANAVKLRLGKI